MKYLLITITSLMFMACGDGVKIDPNADVNVTAVIVKINQNEDAMIQTGKTTSPALCNTALFKNTTNKMHFTFTACGNCIENETDRCLQCQRGNCHDVNLNDAWVYGHNIGDTVHFKYVNRNRYFNIKNKE